MNQQILILENKIEGLSLQQQAYRNKLRNLQILIEQLDEKKSRISNQIERLKESGESKDFPAGATEQDMSPISNFRY